MLKLLNANSIFTILVFSNLFLTSYVITKEPFELYPGYLIIFILLPFWMVRYKVNASLLTLFIILLIGGIYGISSGNNTTEAFLKIYINIVFNLLFYFYLVKFFEFDISKLFNFYMIGARLMFVIGFIQLVSFQIGFQSGYDYGALLNKWNWHEGGNFGIKLNAIFSEPAYWGASLAPAFFIAFYNLVTRSNHFISLRWSIFIIILYPLSFSSVGYIGIFLAVSLILLNLGGVKLTIVTVPLLLMGHFYLLENVEEYKDRFEGSTKLAEGEATQAFDVHGSSFVLYNHTHVMTENLKRNPLLGTGLGSHQFAYDKYSLVREYGGIYDFNRLDANSMALRTLSETGIVGGLILLFFIFRFFIYRGSHPEGDYWLISNACFVIIILQLLRQGNYTYNGFFFFLVLYYYSWKKAQEAKHEEVLELETEVTK